jgi:hypothetical protein
VPFGVPRRDTRLQIDTAEQRPARLIRPAHRRPPQNLRRVNPEGESCSSDLAKGRLLRQPARRSRTASHGRSWHER